MSRYAGSYRGTVVNRDDPTMQMRVQVQVPELFADGDPVWAMPSLGAGGTTLLPEIGDSVWVTFEAGDQDHPVWQPVEGNESRDEHGFVGTYRGVVVDNMDPLQQGRLQVQVPDVSPDFLGWAQPASADLAAAEPPTVGTNVWVDFDGGDVQYPRWTGTF